MQTLRRFYEYTFYWGYEWSLRKYGAVQGPEITGLGIVVLCLYFNLFALVLALGWLLHLFTQLPHLPKWGLALFLLAFMVPHYWYLVRGNRYRALAAEYDAWDADRRWHMNRRVIFYILGSIFALGLAAYCGKNYPNPLHLPW